MSGDKTRHEVIYCEGCNTPCFYNYELGHWSDTEGNIMYTGKHCSKSCYQMILKELEIEFTHNSQMRTSLVRRLKMYQNLEKYRCKECGSCSGWACHCMAWDEELSRHVLKEDVGQLCMDEYLDKYCPNYVKLTEEQKKWVE